MDPFARLSPAARSILGGGGRRQGDPLEAWAGMARSKQLEVLGAPDVDIEEARQQERLLGPTGARTIAGAQTLSGDPLLGVEEPEPRRGLLEILSDYALRPQSAVTGFVSGLAGADRLRQTRDAAGISDGEMFDEPERVSGGMGLALERFGQGIRGEEKFQAADFGFLAYDRNDASVAERALKSTAGFILDVAIDPITYVSFGGSVLGRRSASVAVNSQARKNAARVVDEMDAVQMGELVREGVRRGGIDEGTLTATLRQQFRELDIPLDGLVNIDDALSMLARDPARLHAAAMDSLAYTSAAMYRSFGAGGTRKYLQQFGKSGTDMWNALPVDLKGGVRFRVPLSGAFNRSAGRGSTPTAISLQPFGTGAVSDVLNLSNFSNGVRESFRSRAILRPLGDNLSGATGATDRATASLIYRKNADDAGRWFGRKSPEVDPKLRATSWASSQDLENELFAFRQRVMGSAQKLSEPMSNATRAFRAGRELGADKFDEAFDRAIRSNLFDEAGDVVSLEQALGVSGRQATDIEIEAYRAASEFQFALRHIESELVGLESRVSGFTPTLLENYWPRVVDDIERELRGRGVSGFANLKNRRNFMAEINDDGTVKRWMTPREIAQQLGSPKFVENAEQAMSAYIVSMNRFIEEERLFQHLLDRGVLFRGGRDAFNETFDIHNAAQRWVQTWNSVKGRKEALSRLGRDEGAERLSAESLSGRPLDRIVADAQRLGEAIQGGRIHGPRLIGDYTESTLTNGARRWTATDGVTIDTLSNGTFGVSRRIDGDTHYLTGAGRWSKTRREDSFLTLDDARASADKSMETARKRRFVEVQEDLREDFMRHYTAMNRIDKDGIAVGGQRLSPFDPANVPMDHQAEYFETLIEGIRRFGDETGLRSREMVADAYRKAGWGAGRGQAFAPATGGNGPKMRKFWQERMDRLGIFGAETVTDDVKRIYRAIENPEGFKKWVDEYYRPFYALQKAIMTSQRGPGYVLRNIQGGMWNAYLVGTKANHFRTAGSVKMAEVAARARAKREAPDNVRRQAEIAEEEFLRILTGAFGETRAKALNLQWIAFEERGLRGRELASKTAGIQATARVTGDVTGDLYRVIPDADKNVAQRVTEWGTSHWWARTMGDAAQGSEDYLRFASFLRGAEMYGLEDGGRAAALMVKATQFDYSDLSRFEAETVKMLVPFYTWTRNNVPLQIRAIISEPGKIAKAIRLNDAVADAFGDPDDPEEPLPGYVRERFGWRVREDIFTGPEGDAITAGMIFGEPLVDINRLFGTRTSASRWGLHSVLNWREVANSTAPWLKAGAPAVTAMELSTGGRLPREEEAPGWARALGLGRVTPEGERVMNARSLRAIRDIVTPLGLAERYAPQIVGNERMERRWYTSLGSAILGIPVSTLDPYQTGAELRQQEQRLRGQFQRELGADYSDRTGYVREVLQLGATPAEMQFVRDVLLDKRDVADVPVEELDVFKMRDTINFLRRMDALRERGVPESTVRTMVTYFKPRTDLEQGVRAGGVQPLTPEELADVGETPASIAAMTDEERANVLARYMARNPDWKPSR